MTINPIPLDDFPRTGRPWNNITPFTYRDGLTYLEVLEALRAWVRDVLTAHLNDEMEEFAENWNQVLNDFQVAVIESFDQKMEEFDVDVQAFKDAVNAQFDQLRKSLESDIANQLTTVNDALAAWDTTYTEFTANIQALVDQWTTVQIENNDVITEQIISDPESATRAALNAAIAQRMAYINVIDYGAVGDGVTDDTAAIQAAFDAADAGMETGNDVTVIAPFGEYLVSAPLTVSSGLDMGQATFRYTGTGTALTVGALTTTTARKTYVLPRLVCVVNSDNKAWSAVPIQGARLMNMNGCEVHSMFIQHFDEGMILEGNVAGFVHTEVHPGTLWANRKQIVLRPNNGGWVNSNNIIGGRAQINNRPDVSANGWGILDDPEACALILEATDSSGPNNNNFYGTSIEGRNADLYRARVSGRYNQFHNVRWEAPGEPMRILYQQSAVNNILIGGYDVHALEETFEVGSSGNRIIHAGWSYHYRAWSASGTIEAGDTDKVLNTWAQTNGFMAAYDPETGRLVPRQGRWRITAKIHVSGTAGGTGMLTFRCKVNGATVDVVSTNAGQSGGRTVMRLDYTDDFSGTDYAEFAVTSTSAVAHALVNTTRYCTFHAEYLG